MNGIIIDRDHLIKTLTDLVQINSINPSLSPDGPGEGEMASYVAGYLDDINLNPVKYEIEPGRFNVVGRLPGRGEGRSLMLNAHMDTVGIEGMTEPFSASIREGKIFGRGAFDMKGSLAACLAAAKALVEADAPLAGDLLVAAVADEEYTSIGTADLVENYQVDGAIVTEPTGMGICIAHKGFVWIEVETTGRAAHGSRFKEGIDANILMGRFLVELENFAGDLTSRPGHPLVGPASLHAAKIHGGTELSMYAANCKLEIERRVVPGEDEDQVIHELQTIVDRLSQADPRFKAAIKQVFTRHSYEISPQAPVVQAVEKAARDVLGSPVDYMGEAFWMDSAILAEAGIETVIFGPSGGGAHAAEEWVELDSVVDTARLLAQAAINYCV
jgi:acetylornithine deacetylase